MLAWKLCDFPLDPDQCCFVTFHGWGSGPPAMDARMDHRNGTLEHKKNKEVQDCNK